MLGFTQSITHKVGNTNGDILFNIIEELDLLITNDSTATYRPGTSSGGDLLDLALVSRQMASRIQSCDVGDDIGSDHLPVHLTLASPQIQKQFQREILQYEKTDWHRFNRPFHLNSMKFHNSDVLSQGMREYGDGTQTVRQTTRGKLITFDPKFRTQF